MTTGARSLPLTRGKFAWQVVNDRAPVVIEPFSSCLDVGVECVDGLGDGADFAGAAAGALEDAPAFEGGEAVFTSGAYPGQGVVGGFLAGASVPAGGAAVSGQHVAVGGVGAGVGQVSDQVQAGLSGQGDQVVVVAAAR